MLILPIFASGDISQIGTTSNNYLKILPYAKPVALGETYVAIGDDAQAINFNPAGLAKMMSFELSLTHILWFQGMSHDNVTFGMPFLFGNFGITLDFFQAGTQDFNIVDMGDPILQYKKMYEFAPYSFFGSVAFATEFSENFFLGLNLRVSNYALNPEATDDTGSSISFLGDIGFIYNITALEGLSVGVVFRNLGPESVFSTDAFMQPIDIKGGIGFSNRYVSLEGDVEYTLDNDLNYYGGLGFKLFDVLSLRGGYKGGTINTYTAGAGFTLGPVDIDYAFVPYNEDELGLTHRATLTLKFGAPASKIEADPKVFSPNGDRVVDYTRFRPTIKNKNKVTNIQLKIYDTAGMLVSTVPVIASPNQIYWNGFTSFGGVAPDGSYMTEMIVEYPGGIKSVSDRPMVEVDNTPPNVYVDAEPKIVKPGQTTALVVPVNFTGNAQDLHGVSQWKLVITDSLGNVFRTFSGPGTPGYITWDGADNTGMNYVKTGALYNYTLYAADSVGNWGRSSTSRVKVLLREIVINLAADTLFDPGKADVKIRVYKDIQKIVDAIKKYPNAKVTVEGHTDNEPVRFSKYGSNEALSQARSEAVIEWFSELFDLDKSIFVAVGKGDAEPVASNDTEEGKKLNRRVTIRIKASIWE